MMKNKKLLILTSVVTVLPMVAGILLWNRLPEQIATHFGMDGEPNGWSSRAFTVFGLPLFLLAVNVFCTLTCERDPKRAGYPPKMMRIVYWICPVASWICAIGIYGYALGYNQEGLAQYAMILVGLFFVLIGNYLPKVKQNYYLGIKLPWTFADEDNWNKTHRLGGRVWVTGGLLIILNYFLRIPNLEFVLMVAMVLIPVVYSWIYSKRKN